MTGPNLDATQLDRYSRHVIMADVGPAGQSALLDGSVLVIGAGGLGSPAIQYLAAAGVGRLGIADDDAVERSNLQRQVIHGEADIGRSKVESAAAFVGSLNPDVDVDRRETRVTRENAGSLVAEYDVVVDAADNFPTRYLVNDACVLEDTPLCHGAVYRFTGQATTFTSREHAPCYRCVFPEAPPPGTVPDCETAGVLGVLPGLVGAVQATEAVKLLLGVGDPLEGRLLHYDARGMRFEELDIQRDPACPACGTDGIESLRDVEYADSCAVPSD